MCLDFSFSRVVDIVNPNPTCTQIWLQDVKNPDLQKKSLVLFDSQIKYIITEEYEDHKTVKIFIRDDKDPIEINFFREEYDKFELVFRSLYNTDI